jgi:hypothetical protein
MPVLDKITKLVLAIGCILLGEKIIWNPIYYNKRLGHVIDVSGFNLPLGYSLIIFGIVLIFFQLRRNNKK